MLGQYLAWTGDRQTVRDLLPAARDALDWCDRYGDIDGDGFLEYDTRSSGGVKNQGWKDSGDAIVDADGEIVPNPIATSELQAYWYAGLQQAGLAFAAVGDVGQGARLIRKARDLKLRFNEAFWIEDLGAYALGLDPEKRQIRSIGSNDGHLLAAGIVPPARGRQVARRLMEPDLFSGWGIRTLSSDHPAYNPFSYHRGSVWPVEQGTIAFGLARYGCWDELHRLAEGVFASMRTLRRAPTAGGHQRHAARSRASAPRHLSEELRAAGVVGIRNRHARPIDARHASPSRPSGPRRRPAPPALAPRPPGRGHPGRLIDARPRVPSAAGWPNEVSGHSPVGTGPCPPPAAAAGSGRSPAGTTMGGRHVGLGGVDKPLRVGRATNP